MMPGRMNSREVRRMMAQMGIKSTDMTDVTRIVMEADQKNYVIDDPQVTVIEAQGEKYFQITGKMVEKSKQASAAPAKAQAQSFSDEDIKMVMDAAGVDRTKATEALKKADGEVAKAIVDLSPE